ncbi:hypothetical protein [Solobacterium moorei]|uniref:hypothetical protein n=1 Tax=Solobacterium moorei TaxID=102148 RepID=UPI0028E5D7A4|nr:hypothetical protein [Solobacterium moorei]
MKLLRNILVGMLVLAFLGVAIYLGLKQGKPEQKPETSVTEEVAGLKLKKASLYQFEDLNYRFVIADIEVDHADALQAKDLITSEGISLGKLEKYKNTFIAKDYDWNKIGLKEIQQSHLLRLFIPVLDSKLTKITLTSEKYKDLSLNIDLNIKVITDNKEFATTAKVAPTPTPETAVTPTDNTNYAIFELPNTALAQQIDGSEVGYSLPSHARVFAVRLKEVNSKKIISAVLNVPTGERVNAEDASIYSVRYANLINQSVADNPNAVLLFIVLDQDRTIEMGNCSLTITYDSGESVEMNGEEVTQ